MNNQGLIPEDLRDFVVDGLGSIWALEMLNLLRSALDRRWTVPEITHELRASEPLVRDLVGRLESAGLLSRDAETFRFSPATPFLDDLCARMEVTYRERPMAIIGLIARNKHDPLKSFADAFRIKREDR